MEHWRNIKGYEGLYQVSDLGRVRSFNPHNGNRGGLEKRYDLPRRRNIPMITNIFWSDKGYGFSTLYYKGVARKYPIHRLVAQAFIGNPEGKPQINHKNGIKSDNSSKNLEWCTASENMKHAYRTGLKRSSTGELDGRAKLNNFQVKRIRLMRSILGKAITYDKLAELFKVNRATIGNVVTRKCWAET